MTFVKSEDPDSVVRWSMGIDGDGDVRIIANGIPVAFISCEDGAFHPMILSRPNDESLSALGFELVGGRVKGICL